MNIINKSTPISCLALLCGIGSATADILNVPSVYSTIQSAIDVGVDGDTVLVAPGDYAEKIDFIGKAITIASTDGPNLTFIDGANSGTVVTFESGEGPTSVFQGFTVRNGAASFGAGMTMRGASPTIVGNIFDGNAQSAGGFGAAIGGNSSSPAIEGNIFRNNTCDNQFLSAVVSFVNGSSPRILNNVFEQNPCRAINFTLPVGNHPDVLNNTIVGNRVGVRVDRRVETVFQIFGNNIIVGNEIGVEVVLGTEANNPTWEHNLVFDNGIDYEGIADQTGVNGNISADPLFVDQASGDFYLLLGSPAIDAGSNIFAELPMTDFYGNARTIDGDGDEIAVVDMGAFEFSSELPSPVDLIMALIAVVIDQDFTAGVENPLLNKLNAALNVLENGNVNAVMNILGDFINIVEAKQGKKISEDQADELIAAAELIISILEVA